MGNEVRCGVAQVARTDLTYRPDLDGLHESAGSRFLSVKIVNETPRLHSMTLADYHIESELVGGHRMRTSGCHDTLALARMIRALSAFPVPANTWVCLATAITDMRMGFAVVAEHANAVLTLLPDIC